MKIISQLCFIDNAGLSSCIAWEQKIRHQWHLSLQSDSLVVIKPRRPAKFLIAHAFFISVWDCPIPWQIVCLSVGSFVAVLLCFSKHFVTHKSFSLDFEEKWRALLQLSTGTVLEGNTISRKASQWHVFKLLTNCLFSMLQETILLNCRGTTIICIICKRSSTFWPLE